jgi:uncharacterized membrane protein
VALTGAAARRGRWVPAGLVLLGIVPVLVGAARFAEVTGGAAPTPDNARFLDAPGPVLVHVVGATLFWLLGAVQFAPGVRRRRPGWHRTAGRLVVPCGLAVALSGLWMTLFYPRPPGESALLTGFNVVFGSAMAGCLVRGFAAARRRDIARHRAWMTRGYAIGLGAGTQFVAQLCWLLLAGPPGGVSGALLMLAGWVVNLAVAERALRSARRRGEGEGAVVHPQQDERGVRLRTVGVEPGRPGQ